MVRILAFSLLIIYYGRRRGEEEDSTARLWPLLRLLVSGFNLSPAQDLGAVFSGPCSSISRVFLASFVWDSWLGFVDLVAGLSIRYILAWDRPGFLSLMLRSNICRSCWLLLMRALPVRIAMESFARIHLQQLALIQACAQKNLGCLQNMKRAFFLKLWSNEDKNGMIK